MSIGLVFDAPLVTQAQYDQVLKEVAPGNSPPAGMLYHVGGPTANGWRVVEVWETQADADRFFKDTLEAALQRANISVRPDSFQVHNIMTAAVPVA